MNNEVVNHCQRCQYSTTVFCLSSEGVGSPVIDLVDLNDVVFEEQEGEPGVKCTSESGEATWTPVVNRRSRKRKARPADPGFDGACMQW